MSHAGSGLTRWLLGAATALGLVGTVRSDDYIVHPETPPRPFLEAPGPSSGSAREDTVLEASAVEAIGDGRLLLVAHDKQVPLRVIDAVTGRAVGAPLTCSKFPAETPRSSKWEAMARDSDGTFYLSGSHSGKTHDERDQHARLIRFRLRDSSASPDSADPIRIDEDSVVSWRIARPLVQALQKEGVSEKGVGERKVEGLTIREHPGDAPGSVRRELVIGLRQPDDLVRVYRADITTLPSAEAELPLTRLFAFDPGDRQGVRCQLTSLEYLPAWAGFLVVTATEDQKNAFHGNTLWFVPDSRIASAPPSSPIQADRVWTFQEDMKAEGLCILPSGNPAQDGSSAIPLILTFDNDAHVTHIPSRFQRLSFSRTVTRP